MNNTSFSPWFCNLEADTDDLSATAMLSKLGRNPCPKEEHFMRRLKAISALALLLLVVIFTLQNAELIEIRFFLWQVSLSRALVIFLVFALGLISGLIFGTLSRRPKANPPQTPAKTPTKAEPMPPEQAGP
jgi:uncharacterized integral membrane protein